MNEIPKCLSILVQRKLEMRLDTLEIRKPQGGGLSLSEFIEMGLLLLSYSSGLVDLEFQVLSRTI